jgi:hypothetical protein
MEQVKLEWAGQTKRREASAKGEGVTLAADQIVVKKNRATSNKWHKL